MPGARGRRQEQAHLARPQAARARSLDALHREVLAGRQDRRQGPQHHRLRRLHRHRRGRRRHGPQERHLVDGQGQQPVGPLQEGRRRRGHHPQHQPRREEGLARREAAVGRPVADHLQRAAAREGREGQGRSASWTTASSCTCATASRGSSRRTTSSCRSTPTARRSRSAPATRSRRRSPTSTRRSDASRCRCAWARRARRQPPTEAKPARAPSQGAEEDARRPRPRGRHDRGAHQAEARWEAREHRPRRPTKAEKKDDEGKDERRARASSPLCPSGCGPPGGWSYILGEKQGACVFCDFAAAPRERVPREARARSSSRTRSSCLNRYPFAASHLLVAPRRHVRGPRGPAERGVRRA